MAYVPQQSMVDLDWEPYIDNDSNLVYLRVLGRYPVKVQDFWVPATRAFEQALIDTGYENPCDWIGSWLVRNVSGEPYWSWHATGGAIDLDYGGDNPDSPDHLGVDNNPYLREEIPRGFNVDPRFQITEAQVAAVESIEAVSGRQVWKWLGWTIGDTMHFEPNCTPDEARAGIVYNPTRYPDVPKTHTFYDDIEWLAQAEITRQPPGSNYRPEDPISRGEVAAMIHRYDQHKETT